MLRESNHEEGGGSEKKKSGNYFLLLSLSVVLLISLFLITPKITFYSVKDVEAVDTPRIEGNNEIEYLGYKYSNNSGIIVSSPSYVHCSWKSPNEDDGWKVCEVVFEIENKKQVKEIIESPNIELDFEDDDNIRNIEISYSNNYEVVDEEIFENNLEVIEPQVEERVLFGVASEEKIEGRKVSKRVVNKEVYNIKKRKFYDFKEDLEEDFVVEVSEKEESISENNESLDEMTNESLDEIFNESIEDNSSVVEEDPEIGYGIP